MKGQTMQIILSSNSKLQDLYLDKDIVVSGEIDFESKEYKAGNGLILSNDIFSVNSNEIINRVDSNCEAFSDKSIAIGTNNKVYTDFSYTFGEKTIAGTRSFRIISGDMDEKTWKLTTIEGLKNGLVYNMRLLNNYGFVGKIVSVDKDNNTISVDNVPEWDSIRIDEKFSDPFLSSFWGDEYETILQKKWVRAHGSKIKSGGEIKNNEFSSLPPNAKNFWKESTTNDPNILWIVGHPELGDLSSYATGAFSHGYGTMAQMQYSHAEGVGTIAAGKYSHAEGQNTQCGYCAHSEGWNTIAAGVGSHAEGWNTLAFGSYSHSEGIYTSAMNNYSFSWNGNRNSRYYDHGTGTFNINPAGGLSGFYIGDKTVKDIIGDQIETYLQKILHQNDILNVFVNNFIGNLSSEMQYCEIPFKIEETGKYIEWTTGIFRENAPWNVVTVNVVPGETLELSNVNGSFYGGMCGFDLEGNVVCRWDPESPYFVDSIDGTTTVLNFNNPENVPEGLTKEQLDNATINDRYHWLKIRYENVFQMKSGKEKQLIMIPNNCYVLKISTGKMKFDENGNIMENTKPIIKRYLPVPINIGKIEEIVNEIVEK